MSTRPFAHMDTQHPLHSRHSLPLTIQTVLMHSAPQRDTNVNTKVVLCAHGPWRRTFVRVFSGEMPTLRISKPGRSI